MYAATRLSNRGAAGIGRQIVRAFAANGAKVFVCDINAKGLENLARGIPRLATKVCDISNRGKSISGQMLPIDNDI
jgi:short-subunit dehydrogenase involved in D-alanine esterification of teichoic acids